VQQGQPPLASVISGAMHRYLSSTIHGFAFSGHQLLDRTDTRGSRRGAGAEQDLVTNR